jgi:hypothetical protein
MSTSDYDKVLGKPAPSNAVQPGASALKVELRDVTEFLNREGEVVQFRPTARRNTRKVDTNKCADIAILVRRHVDADERPLFQRLEVQSPVIQKAIKLTCADGVWINTRVRAGQPIIVPSPYIGLFFAREGIRKYAKKPKHTAEELGHLQLLLNFTDKRFCSIEQERDRLISAGKITVELFWTLP